MPGGADRFPHPAHEEAAAQVIQQLQDRKREAPIAPAAQPLRLVALGARAVRRRGSANLVAVEAELQTQKAAVEIPNAATLKAKAGQAEERMMFVSRVGGIPRPGMTELIQIEKVHPCAQKSTRVHLREPLGRCMTWRPLRITPGWQHTYHISPPPPVNTSQSPVGRDAQALSSGESPALQIPPTRLRYRWDR